MLAFFISMDTHLYFTVQEMSLVKQDPAVPGFFSPFKPLSMKLLMTDPVNHYIIGPTAEYFDEITHFSKVFYFVTPNMISITHVMVSMVSAKMVSSEHLSNRRIAVLLYEFRSWLDDFDGVIYRSHSHTQGMYVSNHNTFGYFVDIYSDILGGIFLMVGIMFYLWKVLIPANGNYSSLPLTKSDSGSTSPVPNNSPNKKFNFNILNILTGHERHGGVALTKKYVFLRCLSVGLMIAVAGGSWDKCVERYTEVFQTDLSDPNLTQIQTEAFHSGSTWFIIYIWRIWEGQTWLHMVLLAVFVDRIWEFLNFFMYLGYVIIGTINILSYIHLYQVRSELQM
ncbi:ceramide phosphoethanolamine synthase-like [Ruditapes philippinarum]|nr:ceramide phosphoethanolamine synthase-like [Ruditapes philippinarum]XP_060605957.1 ceramide phosphoethanolamine synthase-like [Ruditapes philippinarum]XP_060605958.1 ceramide phosphoethanolamine synthase-like [Ruditapes philippinarum]XP_060605959.1 ceramide phosphoethanolamine synthase-like [Ruditapes philippinarum]